VNKIEKKREKKKVKSWIPILDSYILNGEGEGDN
jgi:hypothetical protein